MYSGINLFIICVIVWFSIGIFLVKTIGIKELIGKGRVACKYTSLSFQICFTTGVASQLVFRHPVTVPCHTLTTLPFISTNLWTIKLPPITYGIYPSAYNIVACQGGGISSKPPVRRAATRHGPKIPSWHNNSKRSSSRNWTLLRQCGFGTSQYIDEVYENIMLVHICCSLIGIL